LTLKTRSGWVFTAEGESFLMKLLLEACVAGVESALAAQQGGADRVELCEDLAVGGVTPSAGAIAVACRALEIPVHVLIRPRGGDFLYSEWEFEVMRRDLETAQALGAAGVALGLLTASGAVDCERTARLVKAARPLRVTFHRAFDLVREPHQALEELIALGVDRILTSGGSPTAREGLARLGDLARSSAGRIGIMAGGQIREDDLPAILAAGLREVHAGSALRTGPVTDGNKVRRFVETARTPVQGFARGGGH
jgi:copper homeostasis protein